MVDYSHWNFHQNTTDCQNISTIPFFFLALMHLSQMNEKRGDLENLLMFSVSFANTSFFLTYRSKGTVLETVNQMEIKCNAFL